MLSAADAYALAFQPAIVGTAIRNRAITDWVGASKPIPQKLADAIKFVEQVLILYDKERDETLKRIQTMCAKAGIPFGGHPGSEKEYEAWASALRNALRAKVSPGSLEAVAVDAAVAAGDIHEAIWVARNTIFLRSAAPDNAFLRETMERLVAQLERGKKALAGALAAAAATEMVRRLGAQVAAVLERAPDVMQAMNAQGLRDHYNWAIKVKEALQALGEAFAAPADTRATAPPSPEEQRLLQEILEHPEDDAPRMRYAEMAKKRNDPRAELIELQMIIHDMRKAGGVTPKEAEYKKRAAQLVRAHPEWSEDVLRLGALAATFRRGFVEEITIEALTFIERAEQLHKVAPILHLRLKKTAGNGARLAACPQLARILSIELEENWITDEDIEALAACPYVKKLRYLDLIRNKITNKGVEAIAASPNLKSLVYVALALNPSDDPVDRKVYYDETRYDWVQPEIGAQLEKKYGPLPWLHPRSEVELPDFDQI